MTYELQTLRSVRVYVEPAGSYGVDGSGTPANFIDLPISEGFAMGAPSRDMLDPMLSQVRADGRAERIPGKRTAALQMSMLLASHGVDMAGTETPPAATTWALRRVLGAIMGGVSLTGTTAAVTTAQAGTTATAVTVTATHGARWSPGSVIACVVGGVLEAREVLSVAGDVVSVKEAFSAAPTTGQNVRGGVTFFPTEDPDSSLQFIAQGRELSENFLYRGMQGSFQIEAKPGQLAKATFDLKGCAATKLADHSGINVPSISNWSPIAVVASTLTVPTVGSTTRTQVLATDVSLQLGFAYEPITGYGGTETIIRMRRQRPREGVIAKFTFDVPYEDSTWIDARDQQLDRAVFLQLGNVAGATVLISLPTVQVVDVQRGQTSGGVSGQKVVCESRLDSSAAAGTTEQRYAAFRLHMV
jgi:hypothetical protein